MNERMTDIIFERGNAAKQWMLAELARRVDAGEIKTILDLASGTGRLWRAFAERYPAVQIRCVDHDRRLIEAGQRMYASQPNVRVELWDAQHPLTQESVDAVTAMSALEHVRDLPAFVHTVAQVLRAGGVAYMNYDVGHFRSSSWKERVMVSVSQLLARVGYPYAYMRAVDDRILQEIVRAQGLRVTDVRKQNIQPLKGFFRGASDEMLRAWFAWEETLHQHYAPEQLDPIMWSTTVVAIKEPLS